MLVDEGAHSRHSEPFMQIWEMERHFALHLQEADINYSCSHPSVEDVGVDHPIGLKVYGMCHGSLVKPIHW